MARDGEWNTTEEMAAPTRLYGGGVGHRSQEVCHSTCIEESGALWALGWGWNNVFLESSSLVVLFPKAHSV